MSKFLKTIVNIILIGSILVSAGLLIPPFLGVTTVIVDDLDMETNLPIGTAQEASVVQRCNNIGIAVISVEKNAVDKQTM